MNEQRNNGRGIFYGVIGIATLVVAIVGATFAYFTATAANNVITGDMATVKLSLSVEKKTSAEDTVGLIPMSNGMVEAAVSNENICIDDNGNPVCQVYKIVLENKSSAGQFVDGYVALKGGSGEPLDYANSNYQSQYPIDGYLNGTRTDVLVGTTMRWAQVFCTETEGTGALATCSTGGEQYLGVNGVSDVEIELSHIGNPIDGVNARNIRTEYGVGKFLVGDLDGDGTCDANGDDALTSEEENNYTEEDCEEVGTGAANAILTSTTILGNNYDVIGTNYIRVSDHTWKTDNSAESYKRQDDVTSALVFNHNIAASNITDDTDKGIYYIVVWLTENGKNQTAAQTDKDQKPITPAAGSFFMGNVTFISAQGSEVSATFTDYTRVQSNNAVTQ